ncbi:transglutaminaseTgpA domain-containing protein [Frigoribacterium sp. Leaf186]|uniref:transglutaminaseTgpA domain-containing protein n=1 Tax=Frigoribacterium sp. Leaf186 TaxID=1736293 RepID=UPI000AADC97F|nr:transglutaminaseTgpA domain-containing protein [Frigoribacterium sp. Leaf186]
MTDPSPRVGFFGAVPGATARWQTSVLLWLVLVLSLASLHPVFVGVGWWVAGAVVAGVVLGASLVLRALGTASWVGVVVGAVAGALVTTAFASGGTALLGVVPTGATFARLPELSAQANAAIVDGSAPVEVNDGLLVTVALSVLVVAVVTDLLSSVGQLTVMTGLFPALVLAVPTFVPNVATSWPWVVATVLAYLVLLMVSTGRRPSRAGLVGAAASVAVAGLLTAVVPLSGVAPLTGSGTGTGLATGVNPIIDLGDDLRRGAPVTVLSYRTDDAQGQYLKLVDLVDFSGRTWSPADVQLDPLNTLDALPDAPGIDPGTARRDVVTDVTVGALRSPYLPVPVPPTSIEGLDDQWRFVDESGVTVRSDSEGTQGLEYEVTSRPVDPSPEQVVASLDDAGPDMTAYLSVDEVPQSVIDLAAQVTTGAANPFDAAVELQDYFRDGDFTYSEDTPVDRGYDGSGLDAIETFLQVKSGYCVHFASAMAVMARTLGIPSRVAVGFLPGNLQGVGDDAAFQVSSDDLHTWPELYFAGLGWVPFEPTVGLGAPQQYLQQTGVEPSDVPSDDASTAPEASTGPSATTAPTTAAPGASATPTSGASGAGTGVGPVPSIALSLLAALLLAGLVVPSGLRAGRRRRRLSAAPPDLALHAWHEVVDTARDLGVPVTSGLTPPAVADLLLARLGADGAAPASTPVRTSRVRGARVQEARVATSALLDALQAERFGAQPAAGRVQADARRVIDGLRASSSPGQRVAATIAPRSLVGGTEATSGSTA